MTTTEFIIAIFLLTASGTFMFICLDEGFKQLDKKRPIRAVSLLLLFSFCVAVTLTVIRELFWS